MNIFGRNLQYILYTNSFLNNVLSILVYSNVNFWRKNKIKSAEKNFQQKTYRRNLHVQSLEKTF